MQNGLLNPAKTDALSDPSIQTWIENNQRLINKEVNVSNIFYSAAQTDVTRVAQAGLNALLGAIWDSTGQHQNHMTPNKGRH